MNHVDGAADSNGSGDLMSPRGGKSLPNHSQQLNNLADNEASVKAKNYRNVSPIARSALSTRSENEEERA